MKTLLLAACAVAGLALAAPAWSQSQPTLQSIAQTASEHVKAGRLDEAERIYNFLLDVAPNHPVFLLELAHIQMLKAEWAGAKAKMLQVRAMPGVPENVARNIDQRLAYIAERSYPQRFAGQISYGLTAQDNVNSGPEDRQIDIFGLPFTLSDTALPQSDVVSRAAVDLDYRLRLGDGDRFFNAQMSLTSMRYAEFDALDRQDLGVRLGFLLPLESFPLPHSQFRIYAGAVETWIGDDHYMGTRSLSASLSSALTDKTHIEIGASYQHDDYIVSAERPSADDRDGDKSTLSLVTYHALSDGWRLMGGAEYASLDAEQGFNSWSGLTLRGGVSKKYASPIALLPGVWTTALSAEYSTRDYDEAEVMFSTVPQSTNITRISFVQTLPLSAVSEVKIGLTRSKAASSYDIYSWSDQTASLSVVYKF